MVVIASLMALVAFNSQPEERVTLDDLSFLVGQWDGEAGSFYPDQVEELWLSPARGTMFCTSRTVDRHCGVPPPRITLTSLWEDAEGVSGAMRHVWPDLEFSEPNADPISFRVEIIGDQRIVFAMTDPECRIKSITYMLVGERLVCHTVYPSDDGEYKHLTGFDRAE